MQLSLEFTFEDTDLAAIGHSLKLGRDATDAEVKAEIERMVFYWLDECGDAMHGLE